MPHEIHSKKQLDMPLVLPAHTYKENKWLQVTVMDEYNVILLLTYTSEIFSLYYVTLCDDN